ncbi:hypothetical protein [Bosea sp. AAP35]|uniref:hypothetical protein n=1 Tax=Bosea sp. AAP35 TaxID=1523417 RepID=UPI001AEBD2B5|nr:hypothetical protein [Bosea sp. AAP35]
MKTDIETGVPTEIPLAAIKIDSRGLRKATARVAELAGHVEDSSEERELEALVDAIVAWSNREGTSGRLWDSMSSTGGQHGR